MRENVRGCFFLNTVYTGQRGSGGEVTSSVDLRPSTVEYVRTYSVLELT